MLSVDDCWSILEAQIGPPLALPPGAPAAAILHAETELGLQFPGDLRRFLLRHDGSPGHVISPYKLGGGGQSFMAIADIVATAKLMVEIGASFEQEGEFGQQTGPVKPHYWNRQWIPFTDDGCGDNIVVDLDPGAGGTVGQIVDWCHEGGVSTYQTSSLRLWLNEVIQEIRNGRYKFGT